MTLDQIGALCNAATGGPWKVGRLHGGTIVTTQSGAYRGSIVAEEVREEDAAFIAAARDLVPKLADLWEAAKGLEWPCEQPIADSNGDGVWVTPILLDCGECPACRLQAALAALEAP